MDIKTRNEKQLRASYALQKKNNDWNFYEEREFIENLFQTRFNFLITTYALFITAFAVSQEPIFKWFILGIGLFVITLMGLAVVRIRLRAKLIVKMMHKLEDEHQIVKMFDDEIKQHKFMSMINANGIIGVFIPALLVLSFIVLAILLVFFNF